MLQERGLSVTDDLVEMLDVLIGRIFTSSARARDNEFAQPGKAININLRLFRSVAAVLLDLDIADDEVRARAFALIPHTQLQQAYEQSAVLVQPEDFNSFAFLVKRYAYQRSFLVDILEAVPFTGTDAAKPTLEAIAFIRQLDATKPKWKKLPPETPCAFVPDS